MGSSEAASVGKTTGNSVRATLTTGYVVSLAMGAVCMLVTLSLTRHQWAARFSSGLLSAFLGTAFFIGAGAFADRFRVRVGERVEVSASFLPDFLAAIILGPLVGAIVAGAAIVSWWQKGQLLRNVAHFSVFVICGGTCGLVYLALGGSLSPPGEPIAGLGLVLGGIAAGLAYQFVDYILFVPIAWLRRGVGPLAYFREAIQPFLLFQLFFLVLSLGLAFSFEHSGPLGFALFFLPVFGLIYAFRIYARELELSKRLERFSMQMAASMITALDLKDNYTAQHSASVAQYALDIARELGLDRREQNLAHLAGLLHDLGKISVPDDVLGSTERLSQNEWEILKFHSVAGQRILSDMSEFSDLSSIVRHHHERYDGSGYPDGLAGEEIPLLSRVVSVADAYSAMVSDRPYHRKRTPEEAMEELERQKGQQFDPEVTDAFIRILRRANHEYRTAEHADFRLQFQKVRFLRDLS